MPNIFLADCKEKLRDFEENSIDSVVTDPPYELGFQGNRWDSTGIANDVSLWKEILRILKPGGHLLSFSSTRTYHRMACAVEDAGFEIRDEISWIYAKAMQKSQDVSREIEKKYGREEAIPWDGWRPTIKPSHEPILLARKPLSEKNLADNVLRWGTGCLNIDRCRVISESDPNIKRFPTNTIFDEESASLLDKQSGFLKSGKDCVRRKDAKFIGNSFGKSGEVLISYGDSGFASRFFYVAKASKSEKGKDNDHPTVKPVKLMEYLVALSTHQNGVVLDPFMGTGTTGIACKNLGIQFIGIEMNEHYFEIAQSRLSERK